MFWQLTEDLRKASQHMFANNYSKESVRYVIDPLYEAGSHDHTKLADSITRQLDGDSQSEVAKPFLYEVANLRMYRSSRDMWMQMGVMTDKGRSQVGLVAIKMIFRWGVPYRCEYAPRSNTPCGVTLFKYLMYRFQMFSNILWSLRGQAVYATDTKLALERPLQYWEIGQITRWLEEREGQHVILTATEQVAEWKPDRFVFAALKKGCDYADHVISPNVNPQRISKNAAQRFGVDVEELKPFGAQ